MSTFQTPSLNPVTSSKPDDDKSSSIGVTSNIHTSFIDYQYEMFNFRSEDFDALDARADNYARLKFVNFISYGDAKRHFIIKDTIRMIRENNPYAHEIDFDFTDVRSKHVRALLEALKVTTLAIEKICISYRGICACTSSYIFDAISIALRNANLRLKEIDVFVKNGGDTLP